MNSPEKKEKLKQKSVRIFCPTDDPRFKNVVSALISNINEGFDVLNESEEDYECICSFKGAIPDIAVFHLEYSDDLYEFNQQCFRKTVAIIEENPDKTFVFLDNRFNTAEHKKIKEFENVVSIVEEDRSSINNLFRE